MDSQTIVEFWCFVSWSEERDFVVIGLLVIVLWRIRGECIIRWTIRIIMWIRLRELFVLRRMVEWFGGKFQFILRMWRGIIGSLRESWGDSGEFSLICMNVWCSSLRFGYLSIRIRLCGFKLSLICSPVSFKNSGTSSKFDLINLFF